MTTKAMALNLRMTSHSHLGIRVPTIGVGNCSLNQVPYLYGYALRGVKQRLHQASFCEAVITAYIGQPVILNGIPLSKIHHAAFDAHLIGINPDQFPARLEGMSAGAPPAEPKIVSRNAIHVGSLQDPWEHEIILPRGASQALSGRLSRQAARVADELDQVLPRLLWPLCESMTGPGNAAPNEAVSKTARTVSAGAEINASGLHKLTGGRVGRRSR